MKTLWRLTQRNVLIYIKDRSAVFFSLLSALILIILYAFFLAEINIRSVQEMAKASHEAIAYLVNSWVMAGIITINTVTVALGVLGIMTDDEVDKRLQAFLVTPVSRFKLTLGYVLSAFIVANMMCLITFLLAQIYIVAIGGSLLTLSQTLKVLAYIVLNVFSSTCIVFFVVSCVKSRNALATMGTLIGTFIGFVAGIYMPVGLYPQAVRTFMKFISVFYGSSLMWGVFMEHPVAEVFKYAPGDTTAHYLEYMGAVIRWNGMVVSEWSKIGIVLGSGIGFLLLSVLMMRKKTLGRA